MKAIDIIDDLCSLGLFFLMLLGVFIFARYCNPDRDSFEKDCAVFYKENHYITKSCEEYRDKLENMEV